jgi:uncharacterized membrane protein (DUF2068 family)
MLPIRGVSHLFSNLASVFRVQESAMSESPPPIPPWEDFVLRLIAVYKLTKAVIFTALGIGLLRLMHHNVEEILRVYVIDPMRFDPENRLVKWLLDWASDMTNRRIAFFSFGAFFYAAVFATEGIGLYLRAHWAEYMVLISTGSLLPIEVYETYEQWAWWKAFILAANLAILLYLIHRLLLDSQNAARRRLEKEARQKARVERGGPGNSAKILADPR